MENLLGAAALELVTDERPALILVGTGRAPQILSRVDFRRWTKRAAQGLQGQGVTPGDLVMIAHGQTAEAIFAFWGALWLGAIPSMMPPLTEKLDPDVYFHSMAAVSRFAKARLILAGEALTPALSRKVSCPVASIEGLLEENPAQPAVPAGRPAAEQIAFLQHSSGTTGLQKGVALSHRAVLNQLESCRLALDLRPDDVIVSWLPLYHDMGLIAGFILPLVLGRPLVLLDPFDWVRHPAVLLRAIHDFKGTLCWLPNFAYNHMARRIRGRDLEGISLAGMRAFVNCSEPVRYDSHALFLERFAPLGVRPEMLAVSYAMAENTFAVTQTPPGRAARTVWVDRPRFLTGREVAIVPKEEEDSLPLVSCGPTIPGTEAAVFDEENGRPLPERRIGQIGLRSSCLLSEYHQRPDLDPFQNGWYMTGDTGFFDEKELFVIGRQKDVIINAGKNIYPQDLEDIVNTLPGIHPGRVVVFGVPDEREGTELIAVVAEIDLAAEDQAGRAGLKQAIRQAIAQQSMVTASYVSLVEAGWLLKTSSGKIARAANREKWQKKAVS